jgi:hypothetical protein
MDIQEATPEQIAAFEKGAADRYAELGVPEQLAAALYTNEMNKAASQLGLNGQAPEPERVEKVASELAEALGKKRPEKK